MKVLFKVLSQKMGSADDFRENLLYLSKNVQVHMGSFMGRFAPNPENKRDFLCPERCPAYRATLLYLFRSLRNQFLADFNLVSAQ